jgi:ubiquinone/menaquinone biosynthesis C-methylase UbiE
LQDSEKWSEHAKEYKKMANKIPIVTDFNDMGADLLVAEDDGSLLRAGCKLLDVCAGPGTFTISFINRVGVDKALETSILISDFATGMVEAAREAVPPLVPGHSSLDFRVIDVQNMDLPSDEYDVVGCMFGYFVPDRMKAFSEVCRVCKHGGKAIFGTWKYAGYAYILNDFITYLERPEPMTTLGVAHCCADPDVLRSELLGLGFRNVVVHERTKVFEVLQTPEAVGGLFGNPMFKNEVAAYEEDFVKTKWMTFLEQENLPYGVKKTPDGLVLSVPYSANFAIATK